MKIKGLFSKKNFFAAEISQFVIKPIFSTLGCIKEVKSNLIRSQSSFLPDDSVRDLLGFDAVTLHQTYNQSHNPVDILSIDNIFIETDTSQGLFFKGKTSGIIQNFTVEFDPCYKYMENFSRRAQWYMIENQDFISSISFELKIKSNQIVSSNGQSVTFWLSIMEVYLILTKCPRLQENQEFVLINLNKILNLR